MNFKSYSIISLFLLTLAPDFTLCSDNQMVYRFPQGKLVDFSREPIEMDYQQKENSKDGISPKTENLINENTQLIAPEKSKKGSCPTWTYRWKYTYTDEKNHLPDHATEYGELPVRCKCCIFATMPFLLATSIVLNPEYIGQSCPFLALTTLGKIISYGTCTVCCMGVCSPCCNQIAWNNGEYCNRCVRKREK